MATFLSGATIAVVLKRLQSYLKRCNEELLMKVMPNLMIPHCPGLSGCQAALLFFRLTTVCHLDISVGFSSRCFLPSVV